MRIAQVVATFPPYKGGTGNVCYHNARELARRGHDVHVFTALVPGTVAYEVIDGFSVHRLRPLVQVGNAPLLPGLLVALRGFDLIHLHFPFIFGAELVRVAALVRCTPLVISFHNDLIGDGARAKLFSLYQRVAAFTVVRGAARLCVVSYDHYRASTLRRALPIGKPLVAELSNGVDTAHFCPEAAADTLRQRYGIGSEEQLLLFVAALDRAHHFKGLATLLQALVMLPPAVRLLVAGDGDLRAGYEQQARKLGLGSRVVFAGAILHEATPEFFASADVTVLPSTPPESFGLVLIESLACGTPVIASAIPGVRTVVDDGNDGLLVEPNDPELLAQAIGRIVVDEGERRAMGQRGRAKVEAQYSWTQIGDQLETIYAQVLSAHGSAASETPRRSYRDTRYGSR